MERGQYPPPKNYVKLVASGAVDDGLLEALEDYVKRQRKRLDPQKVILEAIKTHGLEKVVKASLEDDEAAN